MPVPNHVADTAPAFDHGQTYEILRPGHAAGPLVFASPHSGRLYPDDLLSAARLDPLTLRRSEDSFIETLFDAAPRHGAPLIHALFPRVWCDVNREAWELDPAMFDEALPEWVNVRSARVAAGLGTIPRVVATGEPIYRRRLSFAEAERRIAMCWKPFHAALGALLDDARRAHGFAILFDCHSMPSLQAYDGRMLRMPDVILGDAHGTACDAPVVRRVEELLTRRGYSVRRNDPYAGGYITRHYGRPRQHVHALQIELSRALYMDEESMSMTGTQRALRSDIEALIAELAATDWPALGIAAGL